MNLEKDIQKVLSYESTKSSWKNKHTSNEWKLADKVARVVMKEGLKKRRNCGCLDDLFLMLKSLSKEKINQKIKQMEGKFKLKGMLMTHGFTDVLTNDNLTDEKAIQVLKKNKKNIGHFSHYPENWEELLKDSTGSDDTPPEGDAGPGNDKSTREEELLKQDKEVLRKLADDLAEKKGIDKAHRMCGVPGLTKFILENE